MDELIGCEVCKEKELVSNCFHPEGSRFYTFTCIWCGTLNHFRWDEISELWISARIKKEGDSSEKRK